jgi:magnesium-transporting ATPase (P-type)
MLKGIDGEDIYAKYESQTFSRHLTVVFNLFVCFQIFNMLAARKINDEINIFEGFFTNVMFVGIWIIIVIGQIFIVQVGGSALKVHINGLTSVQWGICLVVGFLTLPFNLLLKFLPDTIVPVLGEEDAADIHEAAEDY